MGTVRVSTAYEFFNAVNDHLIFTPPLDLHKRAKGAFEATSYELYYYAAHEKDEEGKTLVWATLDRTQMWDCNLAKGTNSAHEFVGLPQAADGSHFITIRDLPCPCSMCRSYNYAGCVLQDVCGDVKLRAMRYKTPVECPDMLTAPLTDYGTKVLRAFIKLRTGKAPKQSARKDNLIKCIVDNFSDSIVFEPCVL